MHGYDACAGYHVLRSRASVDAESEIAQILRIFKENEPAAAEAAMEVGSLNAEEPGLTWFLSRESLICCPQRALSSNGFLSK